MPERKENFTENDSDVSKSQRRREALQIRGLAARLVDMEPARLARLPLEDTVRRAIDEARKIRARVARKRQLQYVAKLLRRSELGEIHEALDAFDGEARRQAAGHHRCEAWRDCLIDSGDAALGELLQRRRDADAQSLRQLIRNARREKDRGAPPAASRALFRLLRELDTNEPLPPLPGN
jgi:ribosome-associated protein